ncbi:MAG: glycoside hydrolase family 31 protein [Polyangiaceae bacterium]
MPIPFLLSTKGYGLWLDTTYRTGFVMGSDSDTAWRFWTFEPELHAKILVHDSPLDTIEHFTKLVGRAKLPAAWTFGPRRRVDEGTMIDGVPEPLALRQRGVPTTMVDDTTHFLPIGSQVGREAELAQWASDNHALGYKAIGYFNAYVSVTDDRTADLRDAGRAGGYFVKLEDGSEYDTQMVSSGPQTVATIDMTNPDAVSWYHTILQRALDLGYDGWMLDFGEYLPVNARLYDGRTGWSGHNAFPLAYQKATFEYMRQVRGDDFMYYSRSGYTGTQAFTPFVWSGDPASSFDDVKGLPANVRAGISAGISGIPFWGSDISGYTCLNDPPADKEVYLRWAEFGALSPDMHDENACAQKSPSAPDKWTLWSDDETTQVYGRYASLHTRLNPYLYAAAKEATERGIPVMRHPVLLHPESTAAQQVEFDYYFGPSLYVAPVVRRGEMERSLWLPPGSWIDWWTLEAHQGDATVTRDAPLDVLPLFIKAGGIVPLLDSSVQTLAPDTRDDVISAADVADVLDVRAAVDAKANSAAIELVDGTSLSVSLSSGTASLPDGVTTAASEGELEICESCGLIETLAGVGHRVRITTVKTAESVLNAGALGLSYSGSNRRIRWDVVVIDG